MHETIFIALNLWFRRISFIIFLFCVDVAFGCVFFLSHFNKQFAYIKETGYHPFSNFSRISFDCYLYIYANIKIAPLLIPHCYITYRLCLTEAAFLLLITYSIINQNLTQLLSLKSI